MNKKLSANLTLGTCLAVVLLMAGAFNVAAEDPVTRTVTVNNTTTASWTLTLLLESRSTAPEQVVAAGETVTIETTDACSYSIRAIGDDTVGGANLNYCLNGVKVTPGNQGSDDCQVSCDNAALEIFSTGGRRPSYKIQVAP